MPTNKLTDYLCKIAKPGGKAYKLSDGNGLYLFVTLAGAKSWRLAYRVAAVQKTMTLGLYPTVSLAEARSRRDGARKALSEKIDPMAERKANRPTVTLSEAFMRYWSGRNDVSENYRHDCLKAFENHVDKFLGHVMINEIKRPDLLAVLLRIDGAGHPAAAMKMRTYLSQVWDWAMELGYCEVNIPQSIKPSKAFSKQKTVHFAAIDLPEVPAFWQRLAMEQHRVSGVACKMLAYTWTRTKELRAMRWSQIDGNIWRVPAAVMKKDRDHMVPLSRQAIALLQSIKPYATSDLVFPGARSNEKPISENTILYLIYEIGYRDKMTGHGLRTVASTWANENGFNRDAVERQLSHAPDDKVRAAYNRAEFLEQRVEMIQAWADWLDA
jgi:integrase